MRKFFKDSLIQILQIDVFLENVVGYLEVNLELLKIEIQESISKAIAALVDHLITWMLGAMVLLFLSLGLAMYLNTLFNSTYLGFFSVAFGMVGLFSSYMLMFRKNLKSRIAEDLEDMLQETTRQAIKKIQKEIKKKDE